MKKQFSHQLTGYLIGYFVSLALTLITFTLVITSPERPDATLIIILGLLAIAQIIVQLLFFLHLAQEEKPRWRLASWLAMCMVVLFIVGGSIWIMFNLSYNMMPGMQMSGEEIMKDEGIQR